MQYGDMVDMFRGDMAAISFVTHALAYAFPEFRLTWMLPEFRAALKQELGAPVQIISFLSYFCELDFRNEGHNAERTARNFRSHKNVHVPFIIWVRCAWPGDEKLMLQERTSKKVLTMEFIHGVRLDNEAALKQLGVSPKQVR